jgi:hypothetical protein
MKIPQTTFASISYHFIKNNIRMELLTPGVKKTPLGRWGLKDKKKNIDLSIMYANEDHCGVCSEYAANKNSFKIDK